MEICWSLGIFPRREGQSGRASAGGLLASFHGSFFFVRACYRLDSFSPFAVLSLSVSPSLRAFISLFIPLVIVARGGSADVKPHTGNIREREAAFAATPVYLKGKFAPRDCSYRWLIDRASFSFCQDCSRRRAEVFSCKVTQNVGSKGLRALGVTRCCYHDEFLRYVPFIPDLSILSRLVPLCLENFDGIVTFLRYLSAYLSRYEYLSF